MKLRIKKPNIRLAKPKIIKNYLDKREKKKIYSGINNIKIGKASCNITEGVILLLLNIYSIDWIIRY